jgi:hypothetical protein
MTALSAAVQHAGFDSLFDPKSYFEAFLGRTK